VHGLERRKTESLHEWDIGKKAGLGVETSENPAVYLPHSMHSDGINGK
jgi:hypothetical protein